MAIAIPLSKEEIALRLIKRMIKKGIWHFYGDFEDNIITLSKSMGIKRKDLRNFMSHVLDLSV